jgi:hypothetical protein
MARYMTSIELKEVSSIIDALEQCVVREVSFGGGLTVFDGNGDELGRVANTEGYFAFYLDPIEEG